MNIADILDRAASLIEPEGAWTQGASARDRKGREVKFSDADAVCFCPIGAINRVTRRDVWRPGDPQHFFDELVGPQPKVEDLCDAAVWNDAPGRTQAEAVAKLREAAAKAREQSS